MQNNPLVSIIIPTYNRAHLIGETLDSVLSQTYPNWECIVVDDGSTDNTEAVVIDFVNRDSRFQFHHRPEKYKSGGNGARNYGFELSKGEYVNWFDDDDIMLSNFLSDKIVFVNEGYDLIIFNGNYVDEKLKFIKEIPFNFKSNIFKEYLLWKDLNILTPSILFKKSFIQKFDLFNVDIIRGQETELFSRIFFTINSNQFVILNKITFLYRQHTFTKSSLVHSYNPQIFKSFIDLTVQNIKKSILLKDKVFTNYLYNSIISNYFLILENNDIKLRNYYLKELLLLPNINFFKVKKIPFFFFSYLFNKCPYRMRKYFYNIY